jgi:hypothetical protein
MLGDATGKFGAYRKKQKFFGSFFQKRTASLALAFPLWLPVLLRFAA